MSLERTNPYPPTDPPARNLSLNLKVLRMTVGLLTVLTSILLILSLLPVNCREEDDLEMSGAGELWGVLVAGSQGWVNYRHQADVCHAYQVLHKHGVKDDHIVVMMVDDIARNKLNPTPGVIVNRPNGPDVYSGVPHDYTGVDVTPETFLSVLEGDAAGVAGKGSGKVVSSGLNDHIFVYFADHGASGLVAFPSDFLMATDLNAAIQRMKKNNKFGKFLFYMEACESGSMFSGLLPDDINVLGVTASNATAPSFACYWDNVRETYLGDVFSVKWMEDSDREDIEKESVEEQIEVVSNETSTSTVSQFGEISMGTLNVGQFQGLENHSGEDFEGDISDAVPSQEVPLRILQNIHNNQLEGEEKSRTGKEIHQMKKNRKFVDDVVEDIAFRVLGDEDAVNEALIQLNQIRDFDCYSEIVKKFHEKCFNLGKNGYALRKVHVLANLCRAHLVNVNHSDNLENIAIAIEGVCTLERAKDDVKLKCRRLQADLGAWHKYMPIL